MDWPGVLRRDEVLCTLGLALAMSGLAAQVTATEPAGSIASADSLYASGHFAAAERAFDALQPAGGDTLVALRRASLRLRRNDWEGARAIFPPLLTRAPGLRSTPALLAESYSRDLDFVHEQRLSSKPSGARRGAARLHRSAAVPYRYEGPARTEIRFVQTDPLPLIEVRLDGRGPYLFLLDTGGQSRSWIRCSPIRSAARASEKRRAASGAGAAGHMRARRSARPQASTVRQAVESRATAQGSFPAAETRSAARPTPRQACPAAGPVGRRPSRRPRALPRPAPGRSAAGCASRTVPWVSTSTRTSTVPSTPASRAISG